MNDKQDEAAARQSHRKYREAKGLRRAVNWAVIGFGGFYFCFHAGFVVWHILHNQDWILDLVRSHYAALIGLPFAAYAAVCLVLFLDSRYEDPIEFSAPGFEFKGASGPIILWAICFVAIATCMKLLWNP
jgi:hypothetical protein